MDMSIRFPGLKLILDYVPKSFEIFGFEITIYGVLIAVGMLLGIFFVVLEARRNHEEPDAYLDLAIITLITGVIGARLLYAAFSWSLYKNDPGQILNVRSGGMLFYGGLLGGVLGGIVYCRIRKKSFWKMADLACMGILIGQIIGKWGSFFNRESFGEYVDNILSTPKSFVLKYKKRFFPDHLPVPYTIGYPSGAHHTDSDVFQNPLPC